MIRLDPTTGTFTSFHLSFIQLCMETRSYAAAEPILDNYIHSIPTKIPAAVREGLEYSVPCADVATSGEYIHQLSGHSEKVTLSDVQEYCLLGAMAYLGLRQYKKARQLLEHVLIVPSANTANGLMLEAYKKWVLASCLVNITVRHVSFLFPTPYTNVCRMVSHHEQQTPKRSNKSSRRLRHTRL
jgi:COP9 signalosome complex subunit 3